MSARAAKPRAATNAFAPLQDSELRPAPKRGSGPETVFRAVPFGGSGREAMAAILKLLPKAQDAEACYAYRAVGGELLGMVFRFIKAGGEKSFPSVFHVSVGDESPAWAMRAPTPYRPVYRLPQIVEASTLIVHEGEKCADLAAAEIDGKGLVSTTSMGGAHGVKYSDLSPVAGKKVIIFRDGNEAGKAYGDAWAKGARAAGALSVRMVEPPADLSPDDRNRWDYAWARENGWSVEKLREMIEAARPFEEIERIEASNRGRFNTLNITEFLSLELPPREMLLDPVIPTQGLAMLYAPRGVGKTLVALSLAYAVATGSGVLGWTAPMPRRVLYLDGEMPARTMQERIAMIAKGAGGKIDPEFFSIITPDCQERFSVPSLADPEIQAELEPLLHDVDLIVIDNISTLCESGRENESESWKPLQDWALGQRCKGRSVLFVHHAGKGGQQRGTSKREDILDTVIVLRRPSDYEMNEGARFEVHLEKARGVVGEAANPFEAQLEVVDDAATWQLKELVNEHYSRVVEMANLGLSVRDISDEIGLSKSQVQRYRKQAKDAGELKKSGSKGGEKE